MFIILIGSSGDIIVSHFAVNYHNEAQQLGIDLDELYSALITDGEVNPPEWNTEGRQVNVYEYVVNYLYVPSSWSDQSGRSRQYGYVPFAVLDVSSTGRQTREGSRTLEVGTLIVSYTSQLTINSMLLRTLVSARLLSCWAKKMTRPSMPIVHW